jgi:pimeloyl-ACP methyl ester carboxylesterase
MPSAVVNTCQGTPIEVEYETHGDPANPPLLLVMGFSTSLLGWPEGFVEQLVAAGRSVILFDNRDCGRSTILDARVDPMAVMAAAAAGQPLPPVPYTLHDMADDAFGLLTHLGIERAHIAGASMGGMIVQTMAIDHPERVLSVTSIMSTSGEPHVGAAAPEAMAALLAPPPTTRDEYVDGSARWMIWASKRYGDPEQLRERAARQWDRGVWPAGSARQLAAIAASGARHVGLASLSVPMLVIHGRDDTLITPSGGERTAELVPGARLLMLDDMGHDVPEPLWPTVVSAIAEHTAGAAARG